MTLSNVDWGQPFAETVSIDCYAKSVEDPTKVDIHATVVFNTGAYGEEEGSPISFELSLKNAELSILLPKSQAHLLIVDKESVSREAPKVKNRKKLARRQQGFVSIALRTIKSSFGAGQKSKYFDTLKFESEMKGAVVTCYKMQDENYSWKIEGSSSILKGAAWDILKRRFGLIVLRDSRLPPTLRLEVRCRREDLVISNLELKKSAQSKYGQNIPANKILAIYAYIRSALFESGLIAEELNLERSKFTIGADILELIL